MNDSSVFLKEQLDSIVGNISTITWSKDGFYYYELISRLHLLLVKNGIRQAYYDEVTLKNPEHFENCQPEDIDNILINEVEDYEPRVAAINRLKKISKNLGMKGYEVIQVPIEFNENSIVPEKIVKEFSTTYSNGKQILIYQDHKVKTKLEQLVKGNKRLGEVLGYPNCCVNWMSDTKTKSLEDCYKFYLDNIANLPDKEMMKFLRTSFESDDIPNNDERMADIEINHVVKTMSKYPFVFHQACTPCLENSDSPTSKLNKKYEDFAKLISGEFHQKIIAESRRLSDFILEESTSIKGDAKFDL